MKKWTVGVLVVAMLALGSALALASDYPGMDTPWLGDMGGKVAAWIAKHNPRGVEDINIKAYHPFQKAPVAMPAGMMAQEAPEEDALVALVEKLMKELGITEITLGGQQVTDVKAIADAYTQMQAERKAQLEEDIKAAEENENPEVKAQLEEALKALLDPAGEEGRLRSFLAGE